MNRLLSNIFIEFDIELLTGLSIGGSESAMQIGGVDKVVVRNPLTDEPYIPGSSLRGKMRSSLEKAMGLPLNTDIGKYVRIHSAKNEAEYKQSPVAQIFGVTGDRDRDWARPSRLLVRDIRLSDETRKEMQQRRLDMPYTEIKAEVAIDRITSAANPRFMERVPAGAKFGRGQMVYNYYDDDPGDLFNIVFIGMLLVEDSYIGGSGSRGSGQIRFTNIEIKGRATTDRDNKLIYGNLVPLRAEPSLKEFGAFIDLPRLLNGG